MHSTVVIKKPLITEKATWSANEHNRYAFHVDRRASKEQIRRAVAELYNVRVLSVATQHRKGHSRRLKYGVVEVGAIKRAIVKIHPDDKIELF